MSGLRLIPLGTAGWFPTHGKQTACYLVEMAGCRLLLDAGTGLARLGEGLTGAASDGEPSGTTGPLPEGSRLHVFLTHYHLDHVVGLTYLPAPAPGATVHLHGPSPRITGIGLHEALERLFGMPLFSTPVGRLPLTLTLHIHLHPLLDRGGSSRLVQRARRTFPRTFLAEELRVIRVEA